MKQLNWVILKHFYNEINKKNKVYWNKLEVNLTKTYLNAKKP